MRKTTNSISRFGSPFIVLASVVQIASAETLPAVVDLLEPGAPERIATGFSFTEGPVWHPDGYLLFSDILGDSINRWEPDGKVTTFRSPSGHSNGLTFDRQGRLISCEQTNRQVSRAEADGTIVSLAWNYEGKKLNCPNDVVVKSDGSVYFTDPPYGSDSGTTQELTFAGIYRLSPDHNKIDLLVNDISTPNGLAFSPDEKLLYVTNTDGMNIYAFKVLPDGTLSNRSVLIQMHGWPDGIKVDLKGNLYVSDGMFSVSVYDSTGKHLLDIVTPEDTTNCAFGGPDNKTLFITAGGSVYRVRLKVQGVAVFNASR